MREREKKPRVSADGAAAAESGRTRARSGRRLDYSITIFPLFLFRRILYEWSRGLGEIISRAARHGTARRDATRVVVPPCALYKNRRALSPALSSRPVVGRRRASVSPPSVPPARRRVPRVLNTKYIIAFVDLKNICI